MDSNTPRSSLAEKYFLKRRRLRAAPSLLWSLRGRVGLSQNTGGRREGGREEGGREGRKGGREEGGREGKGREKGGGGKEKGRRGME